MTLHRVTAEPECDDGGWLVRVESLTTLGVLFARDLADVEPRCRKAIAAHLSKAPDDIELGVQLRLPGPIQDRLDIIRQHCADIEVQCDAAIAELIDLGLSLSDTGRVLRQQIRSPRPLMVTNAEVAEHGLADYPDAVGLEWDDHGHCRTVKCRVHVEATRSEYRDLPPDGENVLVYDPDGFACHICDEVGE